MSSSSPISGCITRDAAELIDWLPAGSIARVDLLYPDPWPKRRHWKRRFVSDANVAKLARILRAGGEFRFATDWANYAEWTLLRLLRAREFHLDGRARRRLAQAMAGLHRHALRGEGQARRPRALLSDFPAQLARDSGGAAGVAP